MIRPYQQYSEIERGGDTFELEEGDLKVNLRTIMIDGRYTETVTLSKELDKNIAVKISPVSSNTVEACTDKDLEQNLDIGFIDGDPRGGFPSENRKSGEYPRRYANIDLMGGILMNIELIKTNTEIKPGDYLKRVNNKYWDKSNNPTKFQSFGFAKPNSGMFIRILRKQGV